jgi:hypothetical protein
VDNDGHHARGQALRRPWQRAPVLGFGTKRPYGCGKHAVERLHTLELSSYWRSERRRAQARNMIMSNACPDHSRGRDGEPMNVCSIKVQQPQRT